MTAAEALRDGAARLQDAGIETPQLDARLLLAESAGLSQAALLAEPSRPIDTATYQALLRRRAAGSHWR